MRLIPNQRSSNFGFRFATKSIRSSSIMSSTADEPQPARCRRRMRTCQQMFGQQLPIFGSLVSYSSHRPASPRLTGNLLFSFDRLCNYVKDAYSLLHKMPLKHLHSAKVHISVPHLAVCAHTHTLSQKHYSKPQPEACPAQPASCHPFPTTGRLKQTWKRAVALQQSIPQILPLWECLMCGSTRSNLLTLHLKTDSQQFLPDQNVSLTERACTHLLICMHTVWGEFFTPTPHKEDYIFT